MSCRDSPGWQFWLCHLDMLHSLTEALSGAHCLLVALAPFLHLLSAFIWGPLHFLFILLEKPSPPCFQGWACYLNVTTSPRSTLAEMAAPPHKSLCNKPNCFIPFIEVLSGTCNNYFLFQCLFFSFPPDCWFLGAHRVSHIHHRILGLQNSQCLVHNGCPINICERPDLPALSVLSWIMLGYY